MPRDLCRRWPLVGVVPSGTLSKLNGGVVSASPLPAGEWREATVQTEPDNALPGANLLVALVRGRKVFCV